MTHTKFIKRISQDNAKVAESWNLETTLKVLGFVLSLATAVAAIYQYHDSKEKEYQKAFFDERLRTYTELSETVAKIATLAPESKERADAVQRYWQLFYGKVYLITDAEVEDALLKTSKWVVSCVEKKDAPPDKKLCYDVAGNGYALLVARAARNSIIHTWQVPLNKLDDKNIFVKPSE
ncbi:MAG: hypothetical protein ACYCSZ_06760 [Burkholderiales bacterium]